uniref:ATP synthase F0 subunit 8 n=1 Tax=Acrobeloides nanus TaxID=290746 RepID=A0A914DR46_9BILA
MGDYLPNPRNLFESIVGQVYMIFGIILITYWFTCFAHYYQKFHFVTIRKFLFYLYKKFYQDIDEDVNQNISYRF